MNATVRLSKNPKSFTKPPLNNRKTFYTNLNRISNTKLEISRSRTRAIFGKNFKAQVVVRSIERKEDNRSFIQGWNLKRELALQVGAFAQSVLTLVH